MSYILVRRLANVRSEFGAAKAAIDYLEQNWGRIHTEVNFQDPELSEVRRASVNLEATYIIRLFSTFESVLREVLPPRLANTSDRRSAYELINRPASKWRVSAAVRDKAHSIREFRNAEVHQSGMDNQDVTFIDALAGLNRFLSWLP